MLLNKLATATEGMIMAVSRKIEIEEHLMQIKIQLLESKLVLLEEKFENEAQYKDVDTKSTEEPDRKRMNLDWEQQKEGQASAQFVDLAK